MMNKSIYKRNPISGRCSNAHMDYYSQFMIWHLYNWITKCSVCWCSVTRSTFDLMALHQIKVWTRTCVIILDISKITRHFIRFCCCDAWKFAGAGWKRRTCVIIECAAVAREI